MAKHLVGMGLGYAREAGVCDGSCQGGRRRGLGPQVCKALVRYDVHFHFLNHLLIRYVTPPPHD